MGWVRISDDFYDHPKFATVGPLGIALWVAGLAWCNRNLTDGRIPRSRARTLLDFEGECLAVGCDDVDASFAIGALLVAGLWEECEDSYLIHDYHDFQPTAEQVRAKQVERHEAKVAGGKARAAGATRSSKGTFQTPRSTPPHPARSPAPAEQPASCEGQHPTSPNPNPNTQKAAASEMFTHDPPEASPAAAAARPNWETLPARAFALIAERRIASANGSVANPDAYRASVLRALPDQHAERLAGVNLGEPGWTPERLADFLEPPPRPRFDTAGATTVDGRTFMPGTGWVS